MMKMSINSHHLIIRILTYIQTRTPIKDRKIRIETKNAKCVEKQQEMFSVVKPAPACATFNALDLKKATKLVVLLVMLL